MAEATKNLVERIVTGPKCIWGANDKGERTRYDVGDTIMLSPKSAKAFARYLQAPGVAKAQEAVAKEEAKAASVPETPVNPAPTSPPAVTPKPVAPATAAKPSG